MNKKPMLIMLLLNLSLAVYSQTIQESGVTVEYEYTKSELGNTHLELHVFVEGVTDTYDINFWIDDKFNEDGYLGFVSTYYHSKDNYQGTIYYLKKNDINYICRALSEDFKGNKLNRAIKNKSKTIIDIFKRLLVEAQEAGIFILTKGN